MYKKQNSFNYIQCYNKYQVSSKLSLFSTKVLKWRQSTIIKTQNDQKIIQTFVTFAIYILRPQNNENIEEQIQNSRQSIEHKSHDMNYVKISYIE